MPADTDSDALLMEAERLCNLGLALHALPMLEPLQRHASVRGPLLAARITTHLGGARAADAAVLRLWRSQPRHAALTVQYLRVLNGRRGPYVAWRAMQELGLDGAAEARDRADWHALRASLLADFRDFEGAGAALDAAREAAPDDPWQLVERATVCAAADRYDEAIAAAEQALGMRPGYRPALQSLAHLLSLCGRDGEALDLLRAADSAAQSGQLCAQLYALQFEQGLYADAWASLQRCEYLHPLADRTLKNWLAAQRALTAQRLDMPDAARSAALQAGDDFHRRLAERLAAPDARDRRVLLPVGFVRQHYMTCAPATLAAISGYWGHAASHLEIAEQICYDGTFHHSERHWAESQGFLVREFTVDWDIARALLDAGIPFTLTTTWPGGAHLQAAIGYDELRGTLLIRDPMSRVHGEFAIDGLLAAHRSTGPRGLAFVPPAAAARMAGLHFPDAEIWDIQYAVNAALNRHQRDAAAQAAEQLAARFSGHRLAQVARRTLAAYDGDEAAMLAAVEQLLAMFPDDVNLQLAKAASLAALASRDKQLAWLAGLSCAPDGRPLVDLNHARLLGQDARQAARARTLLRRVLGRLPANAAAWSALADLLWQAGHKDAAIEHYRHAACLAETDEDHAATYFRANQFCGRSEAGLEFLRRRASRLGSRAGAPYMTLFNQLETLERTPEGFELLQQALARRGDDPALLLFAAEVHLRYRKLDAAQELAARVRLPTRRAEWLKLASQLAREQGDPARALELAREAAGLEPFNLGLQRLVASLYTVLEGPARALAYLRELADRFSHHSGLQMLLVDAMAGLPLADIEVILRRLLAINSSSVWAQRELATNLARQQRHAEAMQVMDAVMHLAADQSSTHAIKAFLLLQQGKPDAAKLSLRTALQLYIDNDYALNTLIDLCADLAERREALDFVYRELVRQVTCGDGLLNFREAAQRTLPPPDVLAVLREAHVARPDLWQAWVALGGQLSHMGHSAEALDLLGRAIEKFPLLPAVYCERALAYALRGRREEARADCRLALQINPQWTRAANLYVETVLDEGVSFDRAITVLDAALARNPEDAELRATRASTLWRDGQRPQAVAEMRAALLRAPKLGWAWDALRHFGENTGAPDLPARLAAELTELRPGEVWAWIRLAQWAGDAEQAVAAARRALQLAPRQETAWEALLATLLRFGRLDDAAAALAEHPWQERPPAVLRAFAPRIARARGLGTQAARELRELLADDPNNYTWWRELADWRDADGADADYLEAAQNLVRLAPNHARAHGYAGHARLKCGQQQQAREHFARAFELDPTYSFAGMHLADLQLDGRDGDGAGTTLAALARVCPGPYLAVRQIRLAALRMDQDAAAAPLFEALRATQDDWPAQQAIAHMQRAGWEQRLTREIQACFSSGACALVATRHWIEQQESAVPGLFRRRIAEALQQDPQHALKRGLLDYAGAKRRVPILKRLLRSHRTALQDDAGCWSMVAYAYLSNEMHAQVVDWMQDWRAKQLPAWSLDNLAVALRSLARDEEARQPTLKSLELEPGNMDAKTWLAFDAARADQLAELEGHLGAIDASAIRPYFRTLVSLMQAYRNAVQNKDARLALDDFRQVRNNKGASRVARRLAALLSHRLVWQHSPAWLRPWRWLAFKFG